MDLVRRSSQLSMFYRDRAVDKELWDRAIELFEPIDKICEDGYFGANPAPSIKDVREALDPLVTTDKIFDSRVLDSTEVIELNLEKLEDVTDILHASPLKADIPPNHLMMGLQYGFHRVFCEPPENSPDSALQDVLVDYPGEPQYKHRFTKLLMYNFGGVWMHVLWHAFKGRHEFVDRLAPLMGLMAKAPVIGRDKTTGHWFILAV